MSRARPPLVHSGCLWPSSAVSSSDFPPSLPFFRSLLANNLKRPTLRWWPLGHHVQPGQRDCRHGELLRSSKGSLVLFSSCVASSSASFLRSFLPCPQDNYCNGLATAAGQSSYFIGYYICCGSTNYASRQDWRWSSTMSTTWLHGQTNYISGAEPDDLGCGRAHTSDDGTNTGKVGDYYCDRALTGGCCEAPVVPSPSSMPTRTSTRTSSETSTSTRTQSPTNTRTGTSTSTRTSSEVSKAQPPCSPFFPLFIFPTFIIPFCSFFFLFCPALPAYNRPLRPRRA